MQVQQEMDEAQQKMDETTKTLYDSSCIAEGFRFK
jgi:hypothetical protein